MENDIPVPLVSGGGCIDRGGYTGEPLPITVLDAAASRRHGARCLDGSPPAFYMRNSTTHNASKKWVIFFKGGGRCHDLGQCARARRGAYGGSTRAPRHFRYDGILSPDREVNPFADWNHVLVWYCDASAWQGNIDEPVETVDPDTGLSVKLHFHGWRIMPFVVGSLADLYGLRDAREVLFAGDCAGGAGVLLSSDRLAALLPKAKVRTVSASGFFLPRMENPLNNLHATEDYMRAHEAQKLVHAPHVRCDLSKLPASAWTTGLAPRLGVNVSCQDYSATLSYSTMRSPSFLIMSAVDSCALSQLWPWWTENGGCLDRSGQLASCSKFEASVVREYRDDMVQYLLASGKVAPGFHGGFVHTCLGHADGLRKQDPFSRVKIDGVSTAEALWSWWNDDRGEGYHWHLPCELLPEKPTQCNPTCKHWAFASKPTTIIESHPSTLAQPTGLVVALAAGASACVARFAGSRRVHRML
jgi:hypothetical protein